MQNEANALKLDNQWVSEDQIKHLAQTVLKYRAHPKFALCQGTRRGLEQKWFRESLPGTDVLGTDIADSATQFPHTVQWDFHEMNPDWSGRADFVYSNSLDHAYEPQKAFRAWYDALVVGGVILLDHSDRHEPDAATEMDPFGATLSGLRTMFESLFGSKGQVEEVQTGVMPGVRTFVFQKTE